MEEEIRKIKETSMSKKTIDKLIETCEYLVIPVAGVAAIWGYDWTLYSAAFFGMVISILRFVELCIKK